MADAYIDLVSHTRVIQKLASIQALLEWDQQTKLPVKGADYRAEQITYLAGEIHRKKTDPRVGDWLGELESNGALSDLHSDVGANVRELRRQFDKNTKLPQSLVEEITKCAALGQQVWINARKENDFKQFAPYLKQMFELQRQVADSIGYEDCRYDVLLDDFEPGGKTREVAEVLDQLKSDLVPLVRSLVESSHQPDASLLNRSYAIEKQEEFARLASSKIGFDYDRGRLDVTHHPFCTELGPDDVRLTTRYDENYFNSAFFGTMHEAGHGMYEQGLRHDQYGLPTGKYCSLGIHESQSRMWENNVGRSESFWKYFFPLAQKHFPETLRDVDSSEFYRAVNHVQPSLIRVEADEATYNLHIIIRFELEQELLEDKLDIDDLPEVWNSRYEEYLGVVPPTDSEGVLQDIHWSAGLIGYFATYSLGNLYACQLIGCAENELGELADHFASGEFLPLLKWLNKNIHAQGASYRSNELVENVAGESINHVPLINYLKRKLEPIYNL